MNRSAREGKKCTAVLSGPTDWILRYIKTTFTFYMWCTEPGRSTLYLSTSVLKYNLKSTWNVLKYISGKSSVLVLVLKYISNVLRFSSTFRVHLSTFGFSIALFANTKWVTGVDGTSCSLASVSSVATEWGPHKPTD